MNIKKVEITWEDDSTTIVTPETKLAPEVQGTSLEELQNEPVVEAATNE